MNSYETIFQVQVPASQMSTSPNLLPLGVVLLAVTLLAFMRWRVRWPVWLAIPVFGICVIQGATQMAAQNNSRNAAELRQGQYHVVAGKVQDFYTQADGKVEHFTVGGHYFEYSYYEDLGRFHMPQSRGGPMHEGADVRITYVNNDDIVKLEVR